GLLFLSLRTSSGTSSYPQRDTSVSVPSVKNSEVKRSATMESTVPGGLEAPLTELPRLGRKKSSGRKAPHNRQDLLAIIDDDGEPRLDETRENLSSPPGGGGETHARADDDGKGESTQHKRPRSKAERMRGSLSEILDVRGAAEALGVSERLVLRLLRAGKLPGRKVGREWRILRSAILEWLKKPEGISSKQPAWLEKAVEAGRVKEGKGSRGEDRGSEV